MNTVLDDVRLAPMTEPTVASAAERLLAVGRAGTAEHVERIVRGWRRVDRKAEAEETTRRHRNRAHDPRTARARGRQAEDVSAGTPTMAQQQADALGLLAETALHHGIDPGTRASVTRWTRAGS